MSFAPPIGPGTGRGRLLRCWPSLPSGRILGCDTGPLKLTDTTVPLASGESLVLYTDGFTEAFSPDGESMFGRARLEQALAQHAGSLPVWAERLRDAVDPHRLCNPGKVLPTPRLCGEVPGPYRQHPVEAGGLAERF